MCEDDLERVEMPLEGMYRAPEVKNEVAENGDLEDDIPPATVQELDEEIKKKPQVKLKAKTPAKVKPSKTLLQFSKKKRKRDDSEGSDAELDRTPPPSPPEEESGIEKRRSGRNTKRKKYIDDVKYNFSDSEEKKEGEEAPTIDDILGPDVPESNENSVGADGEAGSGPNYAFIDPTAEDTMIVQVILASRTGTREIADEVKKPEEEPKADAKEEPKEKGVKEETVENGQTEEGEDKTNGAEQNGDKKEEAEEAEEAKEKTEDSETTKSEEQEADKEPKAEAMEEQISESPTMKPDVESSDKPAEPLKTEPEAKAQSKTVEVEEFLVKFKNFSYLHCQWLTEDELLRGDKRVSQKIKRYLQKKSKSADMMDFCDDEPFNPDYVEVDRVLDSSVHTEDKVGSIIGKLLCTVILSNQSSFLSNSRLAKLSKENFITDVRDGRVLSSIFLFSLFI